MPSGEDCWYQQLSALCGSRPADALSSGEPVASAAECAHMCNTFASHECKARGRPRSLDCHQRNNCTAIDTDGTNCFLKRSCRATVAASPSAELDWCPHGRWCSYRRASAVPAGTPSPLLRSQVLGGTVVVHQTHTFSPALLERLLLARRQLLRAGARHFVAFVLGDDPRRDRCADHRHPRRRLYKELQNALGKPAVWCIDPTSYSSAWPDFFQKTRALPWMHPLPRSSSGKVQRSPHWRYPAHNSLGWHWSWANCDLPAIVGLLNRPHVALKSTWLWTIDWDVAWAGDLGSIIESFSDMQHHYLAGLRPHKADPWSWPYLKLRNHMADDDIWQTLIVPQRLSLRMLKAVNQSLSEGRHAFCEMRTPSLCAQLPWCTQEGMRETRPWLFDEFECCNSISASRLKAMQVAWELNGGPGRLLHRVRDNLSAMHIPPVTRRRGFQQRKKWTTGRRSSRRRSAARAAPKAEPDEARA